MDNQNMPAQKNGVVVYCASSGRVDKKYIDTAIETGRLIAESGLTLVNGGGAMGLMAATIEGCIEAGGSATGVLPQFMIDKGWAHPRLTQCISTPTMHVRKATMAEMAVAAIALPGGIGTLDELAEIMTWNQLGLFEDPVIILNTDGFYDPLLEMFRKMNDEQFMRGDVIPARVVSTPTEAIGIINTYINRCHNRPTA